MWRRLSGHAEASRTPGVVAWPWRPGGGVRVWRDRHRLSRVVASQGATAEHVVRGVEPTQRDGQAEYLWPTRPRDRAGQSLCRVVSVVPPSRPGCAYG